MLTAIDGVRAPIDPFSTKYWEPLAPPRPRTLMTAMEPPARRPLSLVRPAAAGSAAAAAVAAAKLVPDDLLGEFRSAIEGSDMTKAGLIEALKKRFPKVGKDSIRHTLDLVAERVGDKRDNKRWVLK